MRAVLRRKGDDGHYVFITDSEPRILGSSLSFDSLFILLLWQILRVQLYDEKRYFSLGGLS